MSVERCEDREPEPVRKTLDHDWAFLGRAVASDTERR